MQYDDGQEIVKGAHNQIGSFRPRLWWPTNLQDSSISGFTTHFAQPLRNSSCTQAT
jgi:hypothetical protein